MCSCTTKSGFFRSVRIRWVLSFFEVKPNLIKTFFRYIVFIFAELPAVYDGVNRVHVAFKATSPLDKTDTLEAKGIPDLGRGGIGFKNKVENRVSVALERLYYGSVSFREKKGGRE